MKPFEELAAHADELVALLQRNLREALFNSRAYLRPSDVRNVASVQANALFRFFQDPILSDAEDHGAYLSRAGVNDQAALETGEVLRRFGISYLSGESLVGFLEQVNKFHQLVVLGYFRAREASILEEQEP